MKTNNQNVAILLAVLAAALYAISTPISKAMLQVVPPKMVAAFLYLGAGIGVGTMMLIRYERRRPSSEERLHRRDIPYTVAMVVLDIAAPILMMYGLKTCTAAHHLDVHYSLGHDGRRLLDCCKIKAACSHHSWILAIVS